MKKNNFFILFLLSALCSCKMPQELVYQNVQNFSIKQVGTQKTTVSLDIRLYNPNHYALKLKHADVDVFLNGNHLGEMTVNERYTLPKQDTFSLPVTLDVDIQNVLPNAIGLLLNSDADIKLTGSIKAGRHGVLLSIPVNYEGKQDIGSGIKW